METGKKMKDMDLVNTLLNECVSDFISPIKKANNKSNQKSFVFVVGPHGVIEIINQTQKTVTNEMEACPDCGGDGYLFCDACKGNGYRFRRTRIGEKNQIEECNNCNGTGDVICATCGGSGRIQSDSDTTTQEVEKELVVTAIRNLFNTHPHNTTIGPVKLTIQKVHFGKHGIYVLPFLNFGTLMMDENINNELDNIAKQFKLTVPIEIPEAFYWRE